MFGIRRRCRRDDRGTGGSFGQELGICYAGISTVTNWAAGLSKHSLSPGSSGGNEG